MTCEARVNKEVVVIGLYTHKGGKTVEHLVRHFETQTIDVEVSCLFKVWSAEHNVPQTTRWPGRSFTQYIGSFTNTYCIAWTVESSDGGSCERSGFTYLNQNLMPENWVYAGEGCAQVLFFESDEVCETSYKDRGGKYQGQRGVTLPRT